jgi:formylglycine-generating enzyme required for sulfatase activity
VREPEIARPPASDDNPFLKYVAPHSAPKAPRPLTLGEARALKPRDSFKECDVCPEMVAVPAGSFAMGSPKGESALAEEQVAVTIPKPFAVGRFTVTRGEFGAFVAATGHRTHDGCRTYLGLDYGSGFRADSNWRSPSFPQNDRHAVVCVDWTDVKTYVAWLSSTTGKTYRLLSEAEREYVARAGTATPYWWGSPISAFQANYRRSECVWERSGECRKGTVPVDAFTPNPWGLYQVHGNVWEWTEDCWNAGNLGNPGNGDARLTGHCNFRVIRGGSWWNFPQDLRSAYRLWHVAEGIGATAYHDSSIGFRVGRNSSLRCARRIVVWRRDANLDLDQAVPCPVGISALTGSRCHPLPQILAPPANSAHSRPRRSQGRTA